MVHIGINAHLLTGQTGYRQAGIHHYIAQLLRHLPRTADLRYTIFTNTAPELIGCLATEVISNAWPTTRPLARIAWEQKVWPLTAVVRRLDLLHATAFVTPLLHLKPTIVTVYDLSFLHYPQLFPTLQRHYLTTQTRRSCRWATQIITISESARQDIHHLLDIPLTKIHVVYPGVAGDFQPLPPDEVAQFRQSKQLPPRFILHVGTLQPRKNLPTLIEALTFLPADVHLMLVGGKGWLYDEIFGRVQTLKLTQRVHFVGYVPERELPSWYNAAEVLAFPSLYEGFGLPIIQALACGTPVVASNVSAMPEAAGPAGLLFDPHDAVELGNRIKAVLTNTAQAATMRQRGLTHAQQFTWSQVGEQTAAVYRRAVASL